jgi:hypothetical protein
MPMRERSNPFWPKGPVVGRRRRLRGPLILIGLALVAGATAALTRGVFG